MTLEPFTKEHMRLLYKWAEAYWARGMQVTPCRVYRGTDGRKHGSFENPYCPWTAPADYSWQDFRKRAAGFAVSREWNGLCLLCGQRSNVTILDLDDYKDKTPTTLNMFLEGIPYVESQRGGRHYYVQYADGLPGSIGEFGMDIKSSGFVFCSPTIVAGGGNYSWRCPEVPIDRPELLPSAFPSLSDSLRGYLVGDRTLRTGPKKTYSGPPRKVDLATLSSMLAAIASRGRLPYEDWLRVCSGVWSEYSFEESYPVLTRHMPEEQAGEYERKHAKQLTTVSMGTVVFMAQECGWHR